MLTYAAAAAAVLAVAVGLGALAAITLSSEEAPPQGAKSEEAGGAKPERAKEVGLGGGGKAEETAPREASDGSNKAAYLDGIEQIQGEAVDASLQTNDKLVRYDSLTAADVEDMEADSAALASYGERAEDLDPPPEYENQHEQFVRAIEELRDANDLAYRLAADPASATQANFEAYDRHIASATSYLRRSNEILGREYKTTAGAREVSLG